MTNDQMQLLRDFVRDIVLSDKYSPMIVHGDLDIAAVLKVLPDELERLQPFEKAALYVQGGGDMAKMVAEKERLQSLLELVHETLVPIAMCDDLTFNRCVEIVEEAYVPLDEALALVRGAHEPSANALKGATLDYVLHVHKPEAFEDGTEGVYVTSPTVPGLHAVGEFAERAVLNAAAQVRRLREDNADCEQRTTD